jgi:DNA-binding MarR family transcriptional regulator
MQQAISDATRPPSPPNDDTEIFVRSLLDVVQQAKRLHGPVSTLDRGATVLLARLANAGDVRGSDLAHDVCLDASTVSRHLRTLEEAGYVSRRPDPADARASLISATPSGRELLAGALAERVATFRRATAPWPAKDRTTLARLIHRLADDLEKM